MSYISLIPVVTTKLISFSLTRYDALLLLGGTSLSNEVPSRSSSTVITNRLQFSIPFGNLSIIYSSPFSSILVGIIHAAIDFRAECSQRRFQGLPGLPSHAVTPSEKQRMSYDLKGPDRHSPLMGAVHFIHRLISYCHSSV